MDINLRRASVYFILYNDFFQFFPTMIKYSTDGMVAQHYPFKPPIMDYIFTNVKPQHLIKLYQCAKFFYNKLIMNYLKIDYTFDYTFGGANSNT